MSAHRSAQRTVENSNVWNSIYYLSTRTRRKNLRMKDIRLTDYLDIISRAVKVISCNRSTNSPYIGKFWLARIFSLITSTVNIIVALLVKKFLKRKKNSNKFILEHLNFANLGKLVNLVKSSGHWTGDANKCTFFRRSPAIQTKGKKPNSFYCVSGW